MNADRLKLFISTVRRLIGKQAVPHLKEWCGDHLRASGCFHGSVGNGWEVMSKYIETQDLHHAKNDMYRLRQYGVCDDRFFMLV